MVKIKNTLLILALLLTASMQLSAQLLVSGNTTHTQDTVLADIRKSNISRKTVVASGQVVFSSLSGYVRILLSDDYGYDLLVYESSPLLAFNGIDNFIDEAIESMDVPTNITFTKIRVEIKNAELRNVSIGMYAANILRTRQQTKADKIALINSNLRSQNALWVAGETDVSQMSYQEKKGLFGLEVTDLQGYEYYAGGIFELNSDSITSVQHTQNSTRAPFVSSFDWRNRHGANNPSSPYYNGVNGWMTSAKSQGNCGSCSAFSALGVVEAMANLYFNRFINPDLSEQELVSCSIGSCSGGWPYNLHEYIKNYGVVDENTFPYRAVAGNCSDKGSNPSETIKIHNHTGLSLYGYPNSEEELKQQIIKSPISIGFTLWNSAGHTLTAAGYKVLQAGDTIFNKILGGSGSATVVIIQDGDARIGQTAWIVKNSHGIAWGDSGYGHIICPFSSIYACSYVQPPVTSLSYTDADIVCDDRDGDGYYFWGIGPKPAHCPACTPDDPDGDDSNPNLGPMDDYGQCQEISSFPVGYTQICGSNRICNSTQETYQITGLPRSATVTWSSTPNLVINSSTGVAACHYSVSGSIQTGTITASIQVSNCPNPIILTKTVAVGTAPNKANILSIHYQDQVPFAPCTFVDVPTYNGTSMVYRHGIVSNEWRSKAPDHHVAVLGYGFHPTAFGEGRLLEAFRVSPYDNRAHVEVRLQNACGWSDWADIEYFRGPCSGNPGGGGIFFSYFPNPLTDELTIAFEDLSTDENRDELLNCSVKLIDNTGKVQRQADFKHYRKDGKAKPVKFNVSDLKKETYYLHVDLGGKIEKVQIVVGKP